MIAALLHICSSDEHRNDKGMLKNTGNLDRYITLVLNCSTCHRADGFYRFGLSKSLPKPINTCVSEVHGRKCLFGSQFRKFFNYPQHLCTASSNVFRTSSLYTWYEHARECRKHLTAARHPLEKYMRVGVVSETSIANLAGGYLGARLHATSGH